MRPRDDVRLSIVCTTWNRADHLEKVLWAYTRLTQTAFEFIVADDGSTDRTEDLVLALARELPFPVKYVRHENRGFRKAATVNLGVRVAEGNYLLVTDCDCLPQYDLLERHLDAAGPGRLVLGECIRMPEDYCRTLDLEAVRAGRYEERRTPAAEKKLRRLQRKAVFYTWIRKRRKPHIRGANFSLCLDDFRRVNGYDENFIGWGNEDGDLRERLKRVGVRPYPIVTQAVVYHLWHPIHETKAVLPNRAYAWSGHTRPARCANGLERLDGVTPT